MTETEYVVAMQRIQDIWTTESDLTPDQQAELDRLVTECERYEDSQPWWKKFLSEAAGP